MQMLIKHRARLFYFIAISWILFLSLSAIYHPTSFNSDPGFGFLDLINYSKGGKFQHHMTPLLEDINKCVEERTTWWTPGQWYFIYLFMKLGLTLGLSITLCVTLSVVLGLWGWLRLYRQFGFKEQVIVNTLLIILFSRYLFTSFQIYPGASILEFVFAPWFLYFWMGLENKNMYWRLIFLGVLIVISFFIKSSMIIFWLAAIFSTLDYFKFRQNEWWRILLMMLVLIAGKYICDLIFTKGGLTPFSYQTEWFSKGKGDIPVQLQYFLFVLQAPFSATIGIDDYIKYLFQKPGHVLLSDGNIFMLLLYGILLFLFIQVYRYLNINRTDYNPRYFNIVTAFIGVYITFFLYALLSGKSITGYEDSRHSRIAGLIILPLIVSIIERYYRYASLIIVMMLFIYSIPSYLSKLSRKDIVSEKYRIPRSITSNQVYNKFYTLAQSADFIYVINADDKYELDHCKTIYNHDDFTEIETIKSRPDNVMNHKNMLFLLPKRFAVNGKKEAILSNYLPTKGAVLPLVKSVIVDDYELIEIHYY